MMKWIVSVFLAIALLLSAYAVFKVKRLESESKPQIRLITLAGVVG